MREEDIDRMGAQAAQQGLENGLKRSKTDAAELIRAAELLLRTLRGSLQSMVHSYLQEMERVPWWRDVREELPEPDELVLAVVSGKPMENLELIHAVQLAEFSRADGWILTEYLEWKGADVSHWMPLPDGPEVE